MRVTGILLIVWLSLMQSHAFLDISAVVGGPMTLPCTCSGVVKWTIFSPIKASIAECHHGVCEIKSPFQKRFSFFGNTSSGNFSISISSTLYNDLGNYLCTCNGKDDSKVKLQVYDPRIVKATEGSNTTLPCYGDTRLDARDVQWKKEGEKLLEYAHAKPNEASAGRFSVSQQGFQDGDLSLHISLVKLSDAGFYLCVIHGESREGDPRAVVLEVEKPQPEQQSPTSDSHKPEHQPPTSDSHKQYLGLGLGLGIGLPLLLLFFAVIIRVIYKIFSQPQEETPTKSVEEEYPMVSKNSTTQIFQD
ncbi:uncharacterized protein LOC132837783 [Tachysurus vachellii]|uniref:uncharacterized protein LOC132837783 n=1 Tax=Tachysurus vachellii TaxID=175792 RepID=UPI00296B1BC3|nr:uncharacterized protein LOC132837783 [Tachysurus vachellii]XP_060713626.1 uncharacterized protein LOC132837783 [Tachysurus vachellii]